MSDAEGPAPVTGDPGSEAALVIGRRTVRRVSVLLVIAVIAVGAFALGRSTAPRRVAPVKSQAAQQNPGQSVQTFSMTGGSMIPTLMPGDRIFVQASGYAITEGAVVVFKTPPGYRPADCGGTAESDLVKRVIGLPGDTIWSGTGANVNTVYVDGQPLSEPYLPKGTGLGAPIPKQTITAGEYFMMGDNRSISCDSRVWGLVPRSDIVGRVIGASSLPG